MTEHKLLPVFIRFNPADRPPEQIVRETLIAEEHLSDDTPQDLTMWEYLKKARFVKHGKPYTPVLIFDQFEELFTLYDAARRAEFVRQFADVINLRMPDPVRDALHRDIDQLTPLQVAQRERSLKVKVVLSIRSDMLSLLDQLSRPIPSILRCRYELKSLSRDNAEKAIVLPAAADVKENGKIKFDTPSFEYSSYALKEILNFLQNIKPNAEDADRVTPGLIESFQLQLICSNIEQNLPEKDNSGNIIVHTNDYKYHDGLQGIINNFYHDTIQSFPVHRRLNIQYAIEEYLIADGKRIRTASYVLNRHITHEELSQLVDKRLLRKEDRDSVAYYEVSHDTLVKPIFENYQIRKTEEERNEIVKTWRNRLLMVFSLLGIFALVLSLWALKQRNKAIMAEKQARNARIEAEYEREKVINEKNRADSLLIIAEEEKQKAIENLEKLTKQKILTTKAEQERNQQKLERLILLANAYIANEGYDLALKELEKARKIAPSSREVAQLIQICKENL